MRRIGEIHGRNIADAGNGDAVELRCLAEGDGRQDSQLVGGVDAIDIKRRLGLGIAKRLRVRKDLVKRLAGLFHAGQDVVAGAIEDARHARHTVACQPFAKRLNRRDSAGNGGLIHQRDIILLGEAGQPCAMMRQHRLVGCDDMLSCFQRPCHKIQRDALFPANHLDHDVNIVTIRDDGGVIDPVNARHVESAIRITASRADDGNLERPAGHCGQMIRLMAQLAGHLAADDAEAGNADTKRGG